MNKTEASLMIKEIDKICEKQCKKIKEQILHGFSEKYLGNFGPQILLSTLASLCARVLHEFVDAMFEENIRDQMYAVFAKQISESMIKAHNELKKQEIH